MRRPEDINLTDMQARRDRVFSEWIKGHINDLVAERPSIPDDEFQAIEAVHFGPRQDLTIARQLGEFGTGIEAYGALVKAFQQNGLIDELRARAESHQSSLIASLHLDTPLDAAITHNGLFVASNDPEFAELNVVVDNQLMSFMNIFGVSVPEVLLKSGHRVSGIPYDGAIEHGMDSDILEYVNRRAALQLRALLRSGTVVHRALSGTRSKLIEFKDGSRARMVPRVTKQDTQTTKNKTPYVVGAPMLVRHGDTAVKILEPRVIEAEEEVHQLMEEMTDTTSDMTGERIVYGLPEGAVIVKD